MAHTFANTRKTIAIKNEVTARTGHALVANLALSHHDLPGFLPVFYLRVNRGTRCSRSIKGAIAPGPLCKTPCRGLNAVSGDPRPSHLARVLQRIPRLYRCQALQKLVKHVVAAPRWAVSGKACASS